MELLKLTHIVLIELTGLFADGDTNNELFDENSHKLFGKIKI